MTTYVDFVPSTTAAFQFQATFDGAPYNVVVTWNEFGQRYFINVYDLGGTLILARAISASSTKLQATFTWSFGTVTAVTDGAHNVPVGAIANMTASDTGIGYDGTYQALATDVDVFTYSLAVNPGQTSTGNLSQDVNLLAGYFTTSTLVFRTATQQFEF
jgi:hypothetical protein